MAEAVRVYQQPHFEVRSQTLIKKEKPGKVYGFDKDTLIFPLHSRRGVLQDPIKARNTGKKEKGNIVYESSTSVILYLDDRFWSLPEESLFTANEDNRHEIKHKKKSPKSNLLLCYN